MARHILHIDMDAFFAAIEQRDRPELRGKPVIVGGTGGGAGLQPAPTRRGVVSSASYEARKFGVRSAMPLAQARKLCPSATFVPVDGRKYSAVSAQVMEILERFSPLVEQTSIDEAYVDLTGTERLHGGKEAAARRVKELIRDELSLTASVGLAPNKFLAKLASDLHKPDGLVIFREEDLPAAIAPIPVSRVNGIGEKMQRALAAMGIATIGDLAQCPEARLVERFGEVGHALHRLSIGVDHTPVEPDTAPKSMSSETTFEEDVSDPEVLHATLLAQAHHVARRLRRAEMVGWGVTFKLRFDDFTTLSRHCRLHEPTDVGAAIFQVALGLLERVRCSRKRVRLIGVGAEDLVPIRVSQQLSLLPDEMARRGQVERAVDELAERFGSDAVKRARLM